MSRNTRTHSLIFVTTLFLSTMIAIFAASSVFATNYNRCCSDTYITEEYVTNEYYETTNIQEVTNVNFDDSAISRAIAVNSAIANIPALSHDGVNHGHTGIGVAVGGYHSDNAIAVGLQHQDHDISYKAALGLSGSEKVYGAGFSLLFD